MAESANPQEQTRRYAAIEQAYCEDRWADVLQQAQALLREVAEASDTPSLGLQQRLQLLLAHTHLYGFGDRDSAEDLYSEVLSASTEPALRQSAEQGLLQCDLPMAPQAAASESGAQENDPAWSVPDQAAFEALAAADDGFLRAGASGEGHQQSPAMPWLGGDGTALIPEVVEEPELIQVHQADPMLAEEIELVERHHLAPGATAAAAAPPRQWPRDSQAEANGPEAREDPELLRGLLRIVIG